MVTYADDCQLIVEAETLDQLKNIIENVIASAQKWYEQNSMKNNIGKTEILIIKTNQQMLKMKFKVTDEGKIIFIKPKNEIKILGVYLDENVTWKRQVSEVRKKASNAIRNLHRINNIVPVKHRVQLYNALVDPHFSYCDVIWGGCGVVNAKRLQTTQNYAVKSILGKRKRDSATDALTQLKFLNLKQRRSVHEAVFSHKALNKKQPDSINRQYESLIPISNTRAASTKTLNLPRHKTAKYQHSLLYRSIKTWNSLPHTISYDTTQQMKRQYQKHLIQTTYSTH